MKLAVIFVECTGNGEPGDSTSVRISAQILLFSKPRNFRRRIA